MSETEEGASLRALLNECRDGLGRARPTSALKSRVSAYVQSRRRSGATLESLSSELGICAGSVVRWMGSPKTARRRRRMVPVEVRAARSKVVVHGAHGVRVEGLSLDELATLLRSLS